MENFNKKIKEKRLEEILFEKNILNELKIKFKIKIESLENKNILLNDSDDKLKLESINIDKESINIDKESINIDKESINIDKESINIDKESIPNGNSKLNENILENVNKITKNKEIIKNNIKSLNKLKQSGKDVLDSIIMDELEFKKEKECMEINYKKKSKNISIYEKKKNNIQVIVNNLNLNLKNKENEIKKYKNEINNHSFSNVIERHSLIQENMNNLIFKKKIEKDRKLMILQLADENKNFIKLKENRKIERYRIKNDYMLNLDGGNVIDEMKKIDKTLKDFDKETNKLIFFLQNIINNLKKNIKRGIEMFDLKQSKKIYEKQKTKTVFNKIIEELILKKNKIINELTDYNKDLVFIQQNIDDQIKNLDIFNKENVAIEKEKNKLFYSKRKQLNEDIETNRELIETNNKELCSKNNKLEIEINQIKKNYYKTKSDAEKNKNIIKIKRREINNYILQNNITIQNETSEYNNKKINLEKRISYLEKRIENKVKSEDKK